MDKDKLKYLTSKILYYLLRGSLDLTLIFEKSGSYMDRYLKELRNDLIKQGYSDDQIYQSINYLKSKKCIEQRNNNKIRITAKGNEVINKYIFNFLSSLPTQKWDKKWRIIVFDVPEKQRHIRDKLRQKMKNLGLYKYQDSVWIFPYKLNKFVDLIDNVYEIKQYVKLINAESLSEEKELLKYYKLKK